MPIISHKHRVVFFPMAKNCSTSIKHLFYHLETGQPFRQARATYKLVGHIHTYYPTLTQEKWQPFYDCYESMTIIRDPVSRFLSGFGNRILHAKALETRGNISNKIKAAGLSLEPDLDDFVDNLEEYLQISTYMRNHLSPQTSIIGAIFPKIKHVFPISRASEIPDFFRALRGLEVRFPHEQSAGPKFKISDLSSMRLKKIIDFYKDDYALFKQHYEPPTL